ncbi:MAG: HDIG domain-containing metalloprotein [Thermodesulfobacteriota bacterium]
MPEKESSGKISRIFGRGRSWRPRLHWSLPRKPLPFRDYETGGKLLLLLGLSLAIALILSPHPQKPSRQYKQGDIAQENIKAVGDFLVEDAEATGQRQKELLEQIPPVYDLDEEAFAKVQARLHNSLQFIRQKEQEIIAQPAVKGRRSRPDQSNRQLGAGIYKELLKEKPKFDNLLGVSIPNPTFFLLAKGGFSPTQEALVNQVLENFFHQGVLSNRSLLNPEPQEILLRRLPSRQEQILRRPYYFLELEEARKPVASYCREVAADFTPAERWLVCDLVQHLLIPNVSPNLAETQERQKQAIKDLRPSFFQVRKGELIVREGERLSLLHLAKLKEQSRIYPQSRGVLIFFGTFLSLVLFLGLSYQVARLSLKQFPTRLRDLAFMAALLLASVLLSKGLLGLGGILYQFRPEVGQNLVYCLPLGLTAVFAAIFLGIETGMVMAFLTAALATMLLERHASLFLYFACAGMVGAWGVKYYRRRGSLIHTGLAIASINLVMLTAFKLLEYPFSLNDLLIGQAFAVSGGLLTGILALGLTPIIETGFRYSSNIRLLELLNLDQPVLKELMLLAPGTYHHSLVVGQMVEASAEAIGANPLLAKAAAYYHDIGKIKKPAYFVENQLGGENKHEKLAPSMSSLILISHVKDGVELARKNLLGDHIIDIIQQHHGTSFISYFYHKAKSQAANPQQVKIEDYRYPGPRPQTKEAGLVLLADQVEAASKTLVEPNPARIQGMVQKIVNNVFADGQLDECELTLKELHLIAKSFNKILSGIFHQRIHYPLPVEKTKAHEDLDKQPAKKNNGKAREGQEKSREDLKRLGLG